MTKRSITVRLEDGLDARPVALLVQEASKYESNIYFEVDDKRINAKSIMGMMSLGLCAGEELTVTAESADAQTAVDNLEMFLNGQKAKEHNKRRCGADGEFC